MQDSGSRGVPTEAVAETRNRACQYPSPSSIRTLLVAILSRLNFIERKSHERYAYKHGGTTSQFGEVHQRDLYFRARHADPAPIRPGPPSASSRSTTSCLHPSLSVLPIDIRIPSQAHESESHRWGSVFVSAVFPSFNCPCTSARYPITVAETDRLLPSTDLHRQSFYTSSKVSLLQDTVLRKHSIGASSSTIHRLQTISIY